MRVISGKWRGRKLKSPTGKDIRPTTDRVKEALYSIIAPQLRDALVIDLCCGTGSLGIEALSRGASRVVFVDSDRRSLACTKTNLELCGATAGSYDLVNAKAVSWLQNWQPPSSEIQWLILADPPYKSDIVTDLVASIVDLSNKPGFVLAALEDDATAALPESTGLATQTRSYGKSQLLFLRRETAVHGETED